MGPTWGQVAPSWSQDGPKLEPRGSKLGRSWSVAGPKLTPSGADFAAVSDDKGAFRRCCADMQNGLPRAEAVPV